MNTSSNEDADKVDDASLKDSPTAQKAGQTARCEYCDKVLSSHQVLRRHISRVHLKIKYLKKCQDCGKSYDRNHLKLHREAVHLKKRKECQDCGKSFTITHLASHRKYSCKAKNKTETKVICHLCGNGYWKHCLQRHIRRHEYVQCDFCPKRVTRQNMKRHKAFHRRVFIKALCV